eukprot:TRINITY_DN3707_c0_g1_i1.p1 TRINITY_DN3707_c0_g1~~TRINITY_DN3707_c0_g1_i1.p1  ORF type:complete len:331 (+),score=63.98 TRINITY_DN3707_c0_g1_i1:31-993(+)
MNTIPPLSTKRKQLLQSGYPNTSHFTKKSTDEGDDATSEGIRRHSLGERGELGGSIRRRFVEDIYATFSGQKKKRNSTASLWDNSNTVNESPNRRKSNRPSEKRKSNRRSSNKKTTTLATKKSSHKCSDQSMLTCERMSKDEFEAWMNANHLSRYLSFFRQSKGSLVLSGRRHVLEMCKVDVDEIFEFLFLPKTASFFNFFDRNELFSVFICSFELFITFEDLLRRVIRQYESISFSISGSDIDNKVVLLDIVNGIIEQKYDQLSSEEQMLLYEFLNKTVKAEFPVFSFTSVLSPKPRKVLIFGSEQRSYGEEQTNPGEI